MKSLIHVRSLLIAGIILFSLNVYGKGFTNPYEFTLDYNIATTPPENATAAVPSSNTFAFNVSYLFSIIVFIAHFTSS